MKICIIIPAYNEQEFLPITLDSLVNQDCSIEQIVVVDDGSTDNTPQICEEYTRKYAFINFITNDKKEKRASGSKVVRAFNLGLSTINLDDYDLVAKIDSDMGFPSDYFTNHKEAFASRSKLGLYGGMCVIQRSGEWVPEIVSNKDHIRGALKTYRVSAFKEMNGLREIMGWDSIDEFLLRYNKWEVECNHDLKVKHFRVTHSINGWYKEAKLNGQVFNNLGYNYFVAGVSSLKRGLKKKPFLISGIVSFVSYLQAKLTSSNINLTSAEKKFINNYRIQNFKAKLL